MKPNYEFKAKVLNENKDLLLYLKQLSYANYKGEFLNKNTGEFITSQDTTMLKEQLNENYGKELVHEGEKINNAKYHRDKRLENKVHSILEQGPSTFITLTFTDTALAETNAKTRRRYVARYLKENCKDYVANIDFGSKNGREHYHAVVLGQDLDYSHWRHLGNINGEKIRLKDKTDTKLGKYISKLTNHAIKETTKRSVIIYARKSSQND